MANEWTREVIRSLGGRFQIIATLGADARPLPVISANYGELYSAARDITFVRGAPTQLESYSNGDPFGDAVATMTFPAVTGWDDPTDPELAWLADYTNIDIWWVPGVLPAGVILPGSDPGDSQPWIDPLTNQRDAISPVNEFSPGPVRVGPAGIKVWEGFIASQGVNSGESADTIQIQCQGALFQADRYLEKPFFPPNPQTNESLIAAVFDHASRPHLRTAPLQVVWPAGWAKVAPAFTGSSNVYSANVAPGLRWTGYTSRSTGAWDRALTGFIQDQIAVMVTQPDSGVAPGNQWTLLHARAGDPSFPAGRTPVLCVRDRFRAPDFEMWYGTPGMAVSLNRDTTQMANLVYGDGTNLDGTVWRNAVIAHDGSRTDYTPLAASPQVFPVGGPLFNHEVFASEAYQKYGSGFNQRDAVLSASQTLQRDLDPGWSGTLTIKTDPSADLSRWQITAGMTVLLKGFRGTGETGMRFHISQVQCSPMEGSVEMTIDTRYRDLLNLEEALARTRDPLTPSKLLQINRNSAIIEDVQAPWDYSAGSGFIPRASTAFYAYAPTAEGFPYSDWASKHPPFLHPDWYVQCLADAPDSRSRWAGPIPILTSEKGTIARSEFFCVDAYGIALQIPFHVSLYYVNVTPDAMPQADGITSPFIPNAFTSTDPATGAPWPPGSFMAGDPSMIICWGNADQPAGFSPGSQSNHDNPTGLLTDDATWTFDNTNNPNYNKQAGAGQTQPSSAITIYAMFYAEHEEAVYFGGRLFRQPQGA
jgi:hypothetical protein